MSFYSKKLHAADPTDYGHGGDEDKAYDDKTGIYPYDEPEVGNARLLKRSLQGRHMQMIAIGGAIGAGLFVGSGSALHSGGPASLVICYIIIGVMMYFVMQALAELSVLFPVNGAFFSYSCRFINPSWGFAMGWDYAIQWLTILPFEITAAGITLSYWPRVAAVNIGAWIAIFLFLLTVIQFFGVRGYGEVEYVLAVIKIIACTGFIVLAIIIDIGGGKNGQYIGAKYWYAPGAFRNGFLGFCSVFANASLAFGGTELTGLAAAEAANPLKSIPKATKQVLWRITIFYVVSLLMVGLIVPSNSEYLLNASGPNTKASPFVLSIRDAGIEILPDVFNGVITLSVLSVANSCAYGSTRTMQALSSRGMAPKFLEYIDTSGRPVWCVIIQLLFGLLAFVNEAPSVGTQFFNWLLSLTGIANFFVWGSICLAHIRFRQGWKAQGRDVDEIPYHASAGLVGSYIGLSLNIICIMASFYVAVSPLNAKSFFQQFLALFVILGLFIGWKLWTRDWTIMVKPKDMDITSGMRVNIDVLRVIAEHRARPKTWGNLPMRVLHQIF